MRAAIVFALAAASAGCGGTTKFAGSTVALSITPDSSVTVPIEELAIMVSGADSTSFSMPPSPSFSAGQTQTFDYSVSAGSGSLVFTVAAMAHGTAVAMGNGSVTVKSHGEASLAIALTAVSGSDMATELADLAAPADMAMPPGDMVGIQMFDLLGVDLAHGPIVPSNTTVAYDPNAADLSGVVGINTSTLQIAIAAGPGNDGGTLAAPPTGVGFVANGSFAVITVGKWTVDKEVKITGTRGLIVVAKSVDINNLIHAEAVGVTAGPGGAGPDAGAGHGGDGTAGTFTIPPTLSLPTSGGGAGAGHFSTGGGGGTAIAASAGAAGPTYGLTIADMSGGSGGGSGGRCGGGQGGAGGGALQISANGSITVELAGVVNAGGGGAVSVCSGGGSGGTIFFEARAITVLGVLSANGGNFQGDAIVGLGHTGTSFGSGAVGSSPATAGGSTASPRARAAAAASAASACAPAAPTPPTCTRPRQSARRRCSTPRSPRKRRRAAADQSRVSDRSGGVDRKH